MGFFLFACNVVVVKGMGRILFLSDMIRDMIHGMIV